MSGQYVVRPHRCELPVIDGPGDVWRCDCGRLWRSTSGYRWVQMTWLERALRGL